MSTQDKMAIRKDFSVIFNDIQDSVLRAIHDMPRPLLMILRLVLVVVLFERIICTCVCEVK
jgi:hypothetical protein